MEPTESLVLINDHREQAVELLSARYAEGHFDESELERRLDLLQNANSLDQIEQVTQDLKQLTTPEIPEKALVKRPTRELADPASVRDSQTVVSIMSGTTKRGNWTPARTNRVIAVMGGSTLDFRDARLAPGTTVVNVLACMGGVEIIVPPDVAVENNCLALMGGIDMDEGLSDSDLDAAAPRIAINGVAFMGGVEIREQLPGESHEQSKKRKKYERKRLGEEHREDNRDEKKYLREKDRYRDRDRRRLGEGRRRDKRRYRDD